MPNLLKTNYWFKTKVTYSSHQNGLLPFYFQITGSFTVESTSFLAEKREVEVFL